MVFSRRASVILPTPIVMCVLRSLGGRLYCFAARLAAADDWASAVPDGSGCDCCTCCCCCCKLLCAVIPLAPLNDCSLSLPGLYGAAMPISFSCLLKMPDGPLPPLSTPKVFPLVLLPNVNSYVPSACRTAGAPCVGALTCSWCSLSSDSPTIAYCAQLIAGMRTTFCGFGSFCHGFGDRLVDDDVCVLLLDLRSFFIF